MPYRFFAILVIIPVLFSCTQEKNPSTATGTMEVRDAHVRPASRGLTGGGYLALYNGASQTDTLTGVSTDAAERVEIHESFRRENEVAGMRPAGKLRVEAGSSLELKPGGYHLMLMQLNRDLAAGDSISVTLHFARNDSLTVRIPVSRD